MGIGSRTAQAVIDSFNSATATEADFRQNITDSIEQVDVNDTRLEADKTIELTGDITGMTTDMVAATMVSMMTEISENVVTSRELLDNATDDTMRAVTTNHIRDDAVTTAKILNSNVTTDKLNNDAVTELKIATAAVTTAKIADSTSTTTGVTTAKIADDAVTNAKLADNSVQTDQIMDANVTTAKINDDAVTQDKLDFESTATFTPGRIVTIAANGEFSTVDGVAGQISASDFSAVQSHSATIPTSLASDVLIYSVHGALTSVTVPVGVFEGQIINISSSSGMTINWGGGAEGIGLAGSARLASGIWRSGGWYFSETVV